MALTDRLKAAVEALLGVSAYEAPPPGTELPKEQVERTRRALGGNIQPLPTSRTRYYLEDLERAIQASDSGNITPAAILVRALKRDGMFAGLDNARSKGLVRLPKRFYGESKAIEALEAKNGSRGEFDEMCPPGELRKLVSGGYHLGVTVGELVPVKGRAHPVFVKLEDQYLTYRWNENRWYFQSIAGLMPVTPGDGHWVLHTPGGRSSPWVEGLWMALGRAFITKEHAMNCRYNYAGKLANPARVAMAPNGATEDQVQSFFRKLMAWGVNNVFALKPGWDVKLLESNGRGWDVFQEQINACDLEAMVAYAGQIVTTTGGKGFANADVPAMVRQDLIQDDGDNLAYTVNTQILPAYTVAKYGVDALENATVVQWDTGTPSDREKESRLLGQAAQAIEALTNSLRPYGIAVSARELATRFGVPIDEKGKPPEPEITPEGRAAAEKVGDGVEEPKEPVGRPDE